MANIAHGLVRSALAVMVEHLHAHGSFGNLHYVLGASDGHQHHRIARLLPVGTGQTA